MHDVQGGKVYEFNSTPERFLSQRMYLIHFPHAYDPYRLIGLVLNTLREQLQLTQAEIGALCEVPQYQISRLLNLETLEKKAKNPHGLNRVHLLSLAVRGFRLNYQQASLLLWLSEAGRYRPWTTEECMKAGVKKPDAKNTRQAAALRGDQTATFESVLELLRQTFKLDVLDGGWNVIATKILHGNSPDSRIALFEKLEEMEKGSGQRMLVSKYPSILLSPDITNSSETLQRVQGPARSELINQLVSRQTTFRIRLSTYGERAIHSIPSLERFVSGGFAHPVRIEERKRRVASIIRHLNKYYPKYQVGLSDTEPEVEIAIKSTKSAVVRGTSRELSNHPDTIVCGPSYLYWDDLLAVMTFYLDFEKEWLKLQRIGRTDKEVVIDELNKLIG